jgi:hypothetical protein
MKLRVYRKAGRKTQEKEKGSQPRTALPLNPN